MIEQEGGAVDQGPGDVLGGCQAPGCFLADARFDVLPQLHEPPIDGDRALR